MNQHTDYVLNKINGPKDLKKLSFEELSKLPDEMRQLVLEKDAAIGGHVGPNLGIMEVTTAFHYVFDAPKDKIVFDVSHQSYGHKMLTGRKNAFLTRTAIMTLLATQILMKANMIALPSDIRQLPSAWQPDLRKDAICFQEKKTSLLLSVTDRSAADWRLKVSTMLPF